MNHYNLFKQILLFTMTAVCIFFPAAVYLLFKSKQLVLICTGFSVLVLLLFLLSAANSQHYIRQTVLQLSDLLSSITDLKNTPEFSLEEDTLLSKLQHQTLRLVGILKAQKQEALSKEQEIKALVSDISHQLKTPLTAVKMYGELLSDESLPAAERNEYMGILMHSLEKLEFLMDALIKMSRLESRIIQPKQKLCSIEQTILKAIRQCHRSAKDKNINIQFDQAEENTLLFHDSRWTCEAIYNILDNSIKYTPKEGKIFIDIQKYEMFCRIDVNDTGPGIPPGEEEKIFHRFYRGSTSSDTDGLGIGLYLSRTIISGQGGYIKLVPQKQGCTFSVFLPL